MLTFKEAAEQIRQEMDHNMSIYGYDSYGYSSSGKIGLCDVCHNVDGIAYRRISIMDGRQYQECISCFWKRRMSELNPMSNEKADRVENVRAYFEKRKKKDKGCALEL